MIETDHEDEETRIRLSQWQRLGGQVLGERSGQEGDRQQAEQQRATHRIARPN